MRMPERTVQRVHTYNRTHGEFSGRHYIRMSEETWLTFDLKKSNTNMRCEINGLLNTNGERIFICSEIGDCKPYKWIEIKKRIRHYDLILSPKLVKRIGIREGLIVDMLLTHIIRFGRVKDEIFPKRLVYGIMDIEPRDLKEGPILGTSSNLIEHEFKDTFFVKLVIEINRAYGFRLYASTLVLLRKLMENLVIELLRAKFGTQNLEMYYWKEKGRHHDFSKLLENLKAKIDEFKPYSPNFAISMIDFLEKFKERSNAAAHTVDIQPKWDYVDSLKKDLNHYCEFFASVISRIKGNTL